MKAEAFLRIPKMSRSLMLVTSLQRKKHSSNFFPKPVAFILKTTTQEGSLLPSFVIEKKQHLKVSQRPSSISWQSVERILDGNQGFWTNLAQIVTPFTGQAKMRLQSLSNNVN